MKISQLSVDTTTGLLQRIPLFAELSDGDLSQLAQHTRVDLFKRDQVIFHQGDVCDRIFVVRQGRVKIVHQEEDGREVILELISAGEVFGGAVLFFPTHPATAKAMEDCVIVSFSSEIYASFLQEHPVLAIKLLRMLGTRHLSMMKLQILAGERVEHRMAHILLKLAERTGRSEPNGVLITIPLSRQDLADMSCTTLETAIRTISRFHHQKLLETHRGGYLLITDLEGLNKLAHKPENP